jgi:hypothetical protein
MVLLGSNLLCSDTSTCYKKLFATAKETSSSRIMRTTELPTNPIKFFLEDVSIRIIAGDYIDINSSLKYNFIK